MTDGNAKSAAVPQVIQYRYSEEVGRSNRGYHFTKEGGSISARSGELAVDVTSNAVEYNTERSSWSVRVAGVGRTDIHEPVQSSVKDNRIDRDFGPVTESVVAGPLGIQQLWTVKNGPDEAGGLTLRLVTGGGVELTSPRDASLIGNNESRLSFGGLYVYDANGKELDARFEAAKSGLLVHVDDGKATYPVVVDPFAQVARLSSGTGNPFENMGQSVAISDDGSTIAVGAAVVTVGASDQSAVYVFTRQNGVWANGGAPTARLFTNTTGVGGVTAISGDGSTIFSTIAGSFVPVSVFVRPVGGWSGDILKTAQLTSPAASPQFGASISVSQDGSTVAIGDTSATGDGGPFGALFVFQRPGGGWVNAATHDARLFAAGPLSGQTFGTSVAVSNNGATIAAGAPSDVAPNVGAVFVFARPGAAWAGDQMQQAKLTSALMDSLGMSVDFSADGKTLAAGGCKTNTVCPYSAVFVTAGAWVTATQSALLFHNTGTIGMGRSIGISGDGKTILVGGRDLLNTVEFSRPDAGWTGNVFPAGTYNNGDSFNFGIGRAPFAFAASGDTFVLGQPLSGVGDGSAYVWVRPQVTGFSPTSGRPGDVITLTGSNFYAGGNVSFGGTAAFATGARGGTTMTATVGAGASGNVSLAVGSSSISLPGFTFIKGDTQTSITSQTPVTTAPGQSFLVSFAVTTAIGTPAGVVSVSASTGETCTASPAAGSCALTFFTQGDRTITATYLSSTAFNSSVSTSVTHSVKLLSAVSILSMSQLNPPSNQSVTVNFTVGGSVGTPTGVVTIVANTGESCTAEASQGRCSIIFFTEGPHTLTATYAGNSVYFPSTSATFDVTTGQSIYRLFIADALVNGATL